ncbi:hypothetical protein SAMN02745824_0450 [Parasphingorhabdus marina DSM 22363]|uniref:Uncharacterized protein n=1 Tax=Parasphingorhabdus marina DSM 22363 TaxID=1123272 RepID=A0A1N6CN35_9SPHN|nr:hypothetical protein [Parasphingorhabdus marina]SIN59912.1 hypothetical protein SAMN02745824_0450 [Parasphingorhabdus marina DSM 22363]
MNFRQRLKYWRYVLFREWKTAGLFLFLALLFYGIFQVQSNGVWSAQENPQQLVYGKVLSIRTETRDEDATQPTFIVWANLGEEQDIMFSTKKLSAMNCKLGDRIQIIILTSDSNRKWYRLGSQDCRTETN